MIREGRSRFRFHMKRTRYRVRLQYKWINLTGKECQYSKCYLLADLIMHRLFHGLSRSFCFSFLEMLLVCIDVAMFDLVHNVRDDVHFY